MDDIGFNFNDAREWFKHQQDNPYVVVELTDDEMKDFIESAAVAVRRCYITDRNLVKSSKDSGLSRTAVLGTVLPDAGSVMSGDFGEILGYFYQSTSQLPKIAIGAKKWRLKEDRTKPAPKSDLVHFIMPDRNNPGEGDAVLCAEVKTKATAGSSTPIISAIEDSKKDQTSRLADTLVWLRERTINDVEKLREIDVALLDRFINLTEYPTPQKEFYAIAVLCDTLANGEISNMPNIQNVGCKLVIIKAASLKLRYEEMYSKLKTTLGEQR